MFSFAVSVLALQAPCCDKVYTCRFCHDDGEDHEIDRHKVIRLECLNCRKQQQVGPGFVNGSTTGTGVPVNEKQKL